MQKNFKVEEIEEYFVKATWKLENTPNHKFTWSKIKSMPLLNDSNEPIGILNDFTLDTSCGVFNMMLEFIVCKRLMLDQFTDIQMKLCENGGLEFKMIK